ncbi:MAG: hypothetical protein JRN15_04835 [Nitrososphaerota archaeon]|nr:hypothetical protein [Nitrososphaerota archaeon]
MTSRDWWFIALGIAALLLVKYVFFGLDEWDKIFHPDRIDNPGSPFYFPFLGVFHGGTSHD